MKSLGNTEEMREMMLDLLQSLEETFNCNHTQEIEGHTVEIFTRDHEKKVIEEYISSSIKSAKPQLMYLCGHPGTGKTSTL